MKKDGSKKKEVFEKEKKKESFSKVREKNSLRELRLDFVLLEEPGMYIVYPSSLIIH